MGMWLQNIYSILKTIIGICSTLFIQIGFKEFEISTLLNDPSKYNAMAKSANPYGDGNASKIIYKFILSVNSN